MKEERFTLKFLGALMESVNIAPKEFRRNLWHVAAVLVLIVLAGRLPELISVTSALLK